MSGIYISGMEMPKSCYTCPFMYHGMRNGQVWCTAIENRWLDLRETLCEERHKDCHLVPVPDHGRLIDADEFFKALTMDDRVSILEAMYVQSILSDAPTIIPADPDKEV